MFQIKHCVCWDAPPPNSGKWRVYRYPGIQRFNDPGGDCYWKVEHPNIHIIESFEVFRYLQDHLAMTQSHVSEFVCFTKVKHTKPSSWRQQKYKPISKFWNGCINVESCLCVTRSRHSVPHHWSAPCSRKQCSVGPGAGGKVCRDWDVCLNITWHHLTSAGMIWYMTWYDVIWCYIMGITREPQWTCVS